MSSPVKQLILDHVDSDRESPVAVPDDYLADENWRWVGFEFAGGVR